MKILTCLLLILAGPFAMAQFPGTTKALGKIPALKVQPAVGTPRRPQSGSWYRKVMDIKPKVDIAGASMLTPIPQLEATMIIITESTEEKYVHHKDKYSVFAAETIDIPAAPNGNSRTFNFAPSETSFDAYRDSSNVGGQVYKYYIFGLIDPVTHQTVYFDTNYSDLESLCKMSPEKEDSYLSLTKGGKFDAVGRGN